MSNTITLGTVDQGANAAVDVQFADRATGAAVDPSPLTGTVLVVSTNTPTTYTYGSDANFVRHSIGNYTLSIDTSASGGRYKVRFKTPNPNAYQFSEQYEFTVTADTL